jgi:hypothetical protein
MARAPSLIITRGRFHILGKNEKLGDYEKKNATASEAAHPPSTVPC